MVHAWIRPVLDQHTKERTPMATKICQWNSFEIWRDGDEYYAEHDVGSIAIVFRRDVITVEKAALACQGHEQATKMLLGLERRLSAAGIDPFKGNMDRYPLPTISARVPKAFSLPAQAPDTQERLP